MKKISKEGLLYLAALLGCLNTCPKVLRKFFSEWKNLEILKGYKAYVQVNRQGEIIIAITGLSKGSSKNLFNDLEAIKKTEIISDKK